ncbi:hypothetical protein D3C76_1380240 [compost metagenome]
MSLLLAILRELKRSFLLQPFLVHIVKVHADSVWAFLYILNPAEAGFVGNKCDIIDYYSHLHFVSDKGGLI